MADAGQLRSGKLRVSLNGQPRIMLGPLSVAELVKRLGLDEDAVAVERNREIVARADWPAVPVRGGDRIEVVHFVGGG